jgi:hypothetical protein
MFFIYIDARNAQNVHHHGKQQDCFRTPRDHRLAVVRAYLDDNVPT